MHKRGPGKLGLAWEGSSCRAIFPRNPSTEAPKSQGPESTDSWLQRLHPTSSCCVAPCATSRAVASDGPPFSSCVQG